MTASAMIMMMGMCMCRMDTFFARISDTFSY